MKYRISTNNISPLLKIIERNNKFIVTENIFKMFMEYNFHQVNLDEQISKLFPMLVEYFDIAKVSTNEINSQEIFQSLFKKYKLEASFLNQKSITNLSKIVLVEGNNLKKISVENLHFINDVIYRYVNRDEIFVELQVVSDKLEFKSEKDYWLLQSLLISQNIKMESINRKLSLYDNSKSILISGNNLENYLENLDLISTENETKIIENNLFNSPIDMELFTLVVNKYLSEKTDEQIFLTLGEKVDFLSKKLNSTNIEDVLFQLNDVLKEGGYNVFKDVNVLIPYIDIIIKAKEIDAQVEVNYFKESDVDFFNNYPLSIQFPIFSENIDVRKGLLEDTLPLEKFYQLAVGRDPLKFEKNPDSTEIQNLAKIVMLKVLRTINHSINPEKGYGQKMKSIKNFDLKLKSGDLYNSKLDWYVSTILMEKGLESSNYWNKLRKYFVLDKNNSSRLSLDEYSHVYENVDEAFEIISQGLKIISLLKEKQQLTVEHIENFINIKPLTLDDLENRGLSVEILNVVDSLQYLLDKESVDKSDLLNISLQKYFLLTSTKSYSKDIFDYKSVVQNFLNGSINLRDDLFLGFRPSELLEYGSVDKLKGIYGYLMQLSQMINNGELSFNNKIIKSNEELIQVMLLDGNNKQKEAAFILSIVFPQIIKIDVNLDLDKELFKKYFVKYMYELEKSNYHLIPVDRIWDINENGKLENTSSNIEIFNLCTGKQELLNYIPGNKDFLKNPEVVTSYINNIINKDVPGFQVVKLWSKIYLEVGSEFFDSLWINISKNKKIDDVFTGLGGFQRRAEQDNKMQLNELATFMLRAHKDLPQILISANILFDDNFLKIVSYYSSDSSDWYRKIPKDYYRHPNAMSILELLGTNEIQEKTLLQSLPKQILITPTNILKVLKKSQKKLEALKIVSSELYDYCMANDIKEEDVSEKMELIFNTMIIEKIAVNNKDSPKKGLKF